MCREQLVFTMATNSEGMERSVWCMALESPLDVDVHRAYEMGSSLHGCAHQGGVLDTAQGTDNGQSSLGNCQ